MSDYKLLSPDKSGSGRDNVLLALKLISEEGVGPIRMSWNAILEK